MRLVSTRSGDLGTPCVHVQVLSMCSRFLAAIAGTAFLWGQYNAKLEQVRDKLALYVGLLNNKHSYIYMAIKCC